MDWPYHQRHKLNCYASRIFKNSMISFLIWSRSLCLDRQWTEVCQTCCAPLVNFLKNGSNILREGAVKKMEIWFQGFKETFWTILRFWLIGWVLKWSLIGLFSVDRGELIWIIRCPTWLIPNLNATQWKKSRPKFVWELSQPPNSQNKRPSSKELLTKMDSLVFQLSLFGSSERLSVLTWNSK